MEENFSKYTNILKKFQEFNPPDYLLNDYFLAMFYNYSELCLCKINY